MNPCQLARKAVVEYIKNGQVIVSPKNLPHKLKQKAGVFVSLHEKNSRKLRGCIGTFLPTTKNIAQEIIENAIKAATADPRFEPVKKEELSRIYFSVDLLSQPKPVKNPEKLDPKKIGLIVSTADGRRGLLLPDLPGIESPKEQINICRQKAGILPDESISYQIFTVERHEEKY